jgi:hypothetical protein
MTAVTRWLPAITQTPVIRNAALGVAGLAFVGGALAGPATAAHAAPAETAKPVAVAQDARKPAPEMVLGYDYTAQQNYYYCAPAATRMALTAMGQTPSQDDVAKQLGTTEAGTKSAEDTTRVLNSMGGKDYHTVSIPGSLAKPREMDRLQADIVRALSDGRPVVANVKGSAVDTDGDLHSYEGGHYLTVTGYGDDGRLAKIGDSADRYGEYWMTTIALANWIAERGYSA